MRIYKRGRIYWASFYDASSRTTRRVSTRCTDRKAAEAYGRQLERYGADPDGETAASATLADALEALMAEYEAREREGRNASDTVEFYRKRAGQVLRMMAEGVLPVRLAELRARHVDAMIDRRRAEGASPSTISKDLMVISMALTLAKRRGQWRGDVDEVMPTRFSPEYKPRKRTLTPEELWSLLAELRPSRAAWVAFAVATGGNLSETSKARAEDVRLAHAWITPLVHLRGTKRELRDRKVPIVYPWQRALLGAAWSVSGRVSGPMFAKWANVSRELRDACQRAGIERVSTNDLRRTFGTWCRLSGASGKNLADLMGHVDSRMVDRVYARVDATQLAAMLAPDRAIPMAPWTVPNLYTGGVQNEKPADPSGVSPPQNPRDFGSSCWTRTSDPVINSPIENREISGSYLSNCTPSVLALRELALGAALLTALDLTLVDGEDA